MRSRLGFVRGGACSAAVFGIVRTPARAAQFEYKAGHAQAADNPQHVRQVQMWEQVARETGGRLVVRVFPNSELGGQSAMLSQLRLNAVQFLSLGDAIYSEVVPPAAIDSVGFAFKNSPAAWAAMNGPLGDYLRKEFAAKGFYIPHGAFFELGMRHVTSQAKPIRTPDDLAGFRIRAIPSKITVDLFQTLGAAPVALNQVDVYPALQTHLVDGQESSFLVMATFKMWEVQHSISLTNHMWTGGFYLANGQAWSALPSDIRAIAERNIAKYSILERKDSYRLNAASADKLQRLGMQIVSADTDAMRARLAPYYARWKREFGSTLWGLLEASAGRLGA